MTQHSDYALRMLIYLGLRPGRACKVNEIAEAYGLSRNHLLKVSLELKRLGFVGSLRGRSGGIVLARKPMEINIGALLRRTEEDLALVECLRPTGGCCVISPECRLKGFFREALDAYFAVLSSYSLADVLERGAGLQALLGITPEDRIGPCAGRQEGLSP